MKLFQYAVIFKPNAEEEAKGEKAALIVPITSVLAKDSQTAMILAGRLIPEEYLTRMDRLEVAVRPFI